MLLELFYLTIGLSVFGALAVLTAWCGRL